MYLKRNKVPKTWPIPRKGRKYLVVPSHNKKQAIPLLIVLREMLKIVKNKKEAKKILNQNLIKINNKPVKDVRYPLLLLDKLEIGKKVYQIIINEKKKFEVKEVKNFDSKIAKIINKKILDKGRVQVNLNDGRNFIIKENINKFKTQDSVLINLKENKIEKIIPLKQGSEVIVTGGKHLGKTGKIEKINEKLSEIKTKEGKINVNLKNLIAI